MTAEDVARARTVSDVLEEAARLEARAKELEEELCAIAEGETDVHIPKGTHARMLRSLLASGRTFRGIGRAILEIVAAKTGDATCRRMLRCVVEEDVHG